MKKQSKKIILSIGIGTIVALVCGAFLSFYPFIGDDLIVREIQFCTFVGNRQSRQRLDRHGTIVVGSCETFHHYNVQGVK